MEPNELTKVLTVLEIDSADEVEIEKVTVLTEFVESALLTYINEETVPLSLNWIVNECVILRYRMIGVENLTSEGISSISSSFREIDILKNYTVYLDSYIENKPVKSTNIRKVRML